MFHAQMSKTDTSDNEPWVVGTTYAPGCYPQHVTKIPAHAVTPVGCWQSEYEGRKLPLGRANGLEAGQGHRMLLEVSRSRICNRKLQQKMQGEVIEMELLPEND